jgi:hypothetical protein
VVQEAEASQVHGLGLALEDRTVEGSGEGVRGQDVEASVAHEGGSSGHRVQEVLQLCADLRSNRCSRSASSSCRAREGVEHLFRGTPQVAAFEAGVVLDAHPGPVRDLPASQARHPPVAARRNEPGLLPREPGPARGQELAHLAAVVHASTVGRVIGHRQVPGVPWRSTSREVADRAREMSFDCGSPCCYLSRAREKGPTEPLGQCQRGHRAVRPDGAALSRGTSENQSGPGLLEENLALTWYCACSGDRI